MDYNVAKNIIYVFLGYILSIFLSWELFDIIYKASSRDLLISTQILGKELIFYLISVVVSVTFLRGLVATKNKIEYGIALALVAGVQVLFYYFFNT